MSTTTENIKEVIKEKYGEAARRVKTGGGSSCCGASACCGTDVDPITSNLYDETQKGADPRRGRAGLAWLRKSDRARRAERRRGRPRPRLRRRN